MSLSCPRCSRALDRRFVGDDASAHVCDSCSGVWLDAHDLKVVCPTLAHLPEHALEHALTGTRGAGIVTCPRCDKTPVEVRVLDVAVDFCTGCHGVWLDAGEYGADDDAPAAKDSPSGRSAYRQKQREDRTPTCAYCSVEIRVADAFMREHGYACARCHFELEQRLAALRAEPDALTRFLDAIADKLLQ